MDLFKPFFWVCKICESYNDTFANSQSLFDHMERVHIHRFSINDLRIISLQSKTQVARPHGQCLLCSFGVDRPRPRSNLASSEQRKKSLPNKNKASQISTEMRSPGPHIADDDASADPDLQPESLKGKETATNQVDLKLISEHIGKHLLVLMLLTMRLVSLQNTEENSHDEIRSQTVETDGDNTSQDLELDDMSGVNAHGDTSSIDDNTEIEASREDNEETTGLDMDWSHVPLPGQVPVEEDTFLQIAARSGAFQAHQEGIFLEDTSKLDLEIHRAAITGRGLPWDRTPFSPSKSSNTSMVATVGAYREPLFSPTINVSSILVTRPYSNQPALGIEEQEQLALSAVGSEGSDHLPMLGDSFFLDMLGSSQGIEWFPKWDT